MEYSKIIKAANILFDSRSNLKKIDELPEDCTPKNFKDAYLIQECLSKIYLSKNQENQIIGKKIGCTNKEAQKQLNVEESFFGNLFLKDISKTNSIIDSNFFFSPYIEPEFSFVMKEDIDISKGPFTFENIYNYISAVLPSIELVDSRYSNWTTIGVYNLIADNAVNGHWIYGEQNIDVKKFDFSNHLVSLFINGKKIVEGNSKNVLGNPINSLNWLINKITKDGKELKKNDFISTGTCTPAIPISNNDEIIADFGKLGIVNFTYK
tara:strand:- start:1171 stop:1968 length:798 start_codon:yes stop_codon:yes gene_type:complete